MRAMGLLQSGHKLPISKLHLLQMTWWPHSRMTVSIAFSKQTLQILSRSSPASVSPFLSVPFFFFFLLPADVLSAIRGTSPASSRPTVQVSLCRSPKGLEPVYEFVWESSKVWVVCRTIFDVRSDFCKDAAAVSRVRFSSSCFFQNTWNTLPSVLYWLLLRISIRQGNSELATPSVRSFSMSSRLYPCETAAYTNR